MSSISFQTFQEAVSLLGQEPASYLDSSEKGGHTLVFPVTIEELLSEVKRRIARSSLGLSLDRLNEDPSVVMDPLLVVTSHLSSILCEDELGCEAYFSREKLQVGVRFFPKGLCWFDVVDIPILQVELDTAEPGVVSLQLSSEAAWGAAYRVSVPALVAYWYARARLSQRPAPCSCQVTAEQINYDIGHLNELGIGPGLASILLHCRAPLLLWAELDTALMAELPGLHEQGIDVAWGLHHPPRGNFSFVPADGFELIVRPYSNNRNSFWGKLPPAAGHSRRVRLLDMCFASEGGDGPLYLQSVRLAQPWTDDGTLSQAPLVCAVKQSWGSLLSRLKAQMGAVEVVHKAIKALGSEGVSDFLRAVQILGAAKELQNSSDGEELAESWAAAFASAQALREGLNRIAEEAVEIES